MDEKKMIEENELFPEFSLYWNKTNTQDTWTFLQLQPIVFLSYKSSAKTGERFECKKSSFFNVKEQTYISQAQCK